MQTAIATTPTIVLIVSALLIGNIAVWRIAEYRMASIPSTYTGTTYIDTTIFKLMASSLVALIVVLSIPILSNRNKLSDLKINQRLTIFASVALLTIGVLGDNISTNAILNFPEIKLPDGTVTSGHESNQFYLYLLHINPALPLALDILLATLLLSIPFLLHYYRNHLKIYKRTFAFFWMLPLCTGAVKVFCTISNIVTLHNLYTILRGVL